jgi:hypothetical protein
MAGRLPSGRIYQNCGQPYPMQSWLSFPVTWGRIRLPKAVGVRTNSFPTFRREGLMRDLDQQADACQSGLARHGRNGGMLGESGAEQCRPRQQPHHHPN